MRYLLPILFAITLHAQDKKIDFTKPLLGTDDKPIMMTADEPMTLADAARQALGAALKEDQTATAEDKFNLGELAHRIHSSPKAVSLTIHELDLIKTRIAEAYAPAIQWAAWTALSKATGTLPVTAQTKEQ